MTILKTLRVPLAVFAFLISCISYAEATIDFTVAPRRGGQNLRFEQTEPGSPVRNEEMTLTVNSDEAVQYQILQTIYQPLTNETGDTIPQDAFVMFSPSSPLGTLRTQLETAVPTGQMALYTSNGAGESDSFIMVYSVRVPENQKGGVYRTQMTFTLERLSAGGAPIMITIDVRLEVRPVFHIDLRSTTGGRRLDFGGITKDQPTATQTMNVEIQSNLGSVYRLEQQLQDPLYSQEGTMLPKEALTFMTQGNARGSLAAAGSPEILSNVPQVIYTSSERGESDIFQIQYLATPLTTQRAGLYTGSLHFRVDSLAPQVTNEIIQVPVRMEIEPILHLDVQTEEGFSTIAFGQFRARDIQKEKKVVLTVKSNMGQPYQVSQIVSRKLTNQQGQELEDKHFSYFVEPVETGSTNVMVPTPIAVGESVIYTSDTQGTPQKFVLDYKLTIPKDARAGSYTSEIRYSITTL